MKVSSFILVFATLLSVPLGAQTAVLSGVITTGAGPMGFGNATTGKPWSGEETTERVQTLADGTRITDPVQKTIFYRDSLGRTRTEHIFAPNAPMIRAAMPSNTMIDIEDPVAGYRYNFSSRENVAHRMKWPPAQVRSGQVRAPGLVAISGTQSATIPAQVAASDSFPKPENTRESLGTQTIEGVMATGTRVTTTYPVGFFGNDRPLTTVAETWMSAELGRAVLTKRSDPRSGESTTRLTNISRAEPDSALFQIPPGMEIKDNSPDAN